MYSTEQKIIETYKSLHQIPEKGLEEHQTTLYIKQFLNKLDGLSIIQPCKQITGLVCKIDPYQKDIEAKSDYLFRCDIDALPFTEESGLSYASLNGMHHACGHDAHTAMMLWAISELTERRKQLKRTIIFCFQPGQEGHGGARKVMQAYPQLLKQVKHCFALHTANHKKKGFLGIPKKHVTSNSCRFHIDVEGKSCHVMIPHQGVDANRIGCQLVNYIYSIKSSTDPKEAVIICVTSIEGGSPVSSVSNKFKCSGTIRSMNINTHLQIQKKIANYAKGLAETEGTEIRVKFPQLNYRSVENSPQAIKIAKKVGLQIFEQIQDSEPCGAGEDFCEFSERVPSCYMFFGVGLPQSLNEAGESIYPIHSSKFRLDEQALLKGKQFWVSLALSE